MGEFLPLVYLGGLNVVLVNLQEALSYDCSYLYLVCLGTHQTLPLFRAVEESENKLTLSWSSIKSGVRLKYILFCSSKAQVI